MAKITVKKVKLSEIKLNPDNPRQISKKDMALLVKSLQEFPEMLELREVVVDETMTVLGGNMRTLALRQAGIKDCTAKIVTGLTPAQKREFVIKDNAAFGEWDFDLLANAWDDLPLTEWGIDLPEDYFDKADEKEIEEVLLEPGTLNEIKDLNDLKLTDEESKVLEGKKPIVEFSGGKDSSAAVLWALHFLPVKPILIYCSIGADHPSLWRHLFNCAQFFECDLKILNSPVSLFEVLEKKGWPHFKFPWCHELMHKTVDSFISQNFDADSFFVLRGGRNQEKIRRDNAKTTRLCSYQRVPWPFFSPIAHCTKKVCEEILFDSDCPLWSGYNYGLDRTACWVCPGQRPTTYAALRRNFPDLWEALLKWEERLGPNSWQGHISFAAMADKGAAKLNASCCLKRPFKKVF